MFGTYQRLGVHVWASDMQVIRAAQRKLKRSAWYDRKSRVERHRFYRLMLRYHRAEQELCRKYRF